MFPRLALFFLSSQNRPRLGTSVKIFSRVPSNGIKHSHTELKGKRESSPAKRKPQSYKGISQKENPLNRNQRFPKWTKVQGALECMPRDLTRCWQRRHNVPDATFLLPKKVPGSGKFGYTGGEGREGIPPRPVEPWQLLVWSLPSEHFSGPESQLPR